MFVIGALAATAAIIFFAPLLGVLMGAFCGWVVSVFAPGWVTTGLLIIGIKTTANDLVSLGAALGFVGGFFRSSYSTKSKD